MKVRHLSRRALPFLGLFLLLWTALAASRQPSEPLVRAVQGTVRDQKGNLLIGAVVQIRNDANLLIRSYITQNGGSYHFQELAADVTYRLQAAYKGHFGEPKRLSKYSSRAQKNIDLTVDLTRQYD